MGAQVRTPTSPIDPVDGGTPPPVETFAPPVDEGPMRRELLRQIALLEADVSSASSAWAKERSTALRGPAVQPTHELERIRDELLVALGRA